MPDTPPIIDVTAKCKSRTEYDTTPASENLRLQIDGDAEYIDLGVRGPLAEKILKGRQYRITVTEIVS